MKRVLGTAVVSMVIGLAAVSCSDKDEIPDVSGEGKLTMTTVITDGSTQGVYETDTEVLAEKCVVFISSGKGLIRKYEGLDEVPGELWLKTGEYVAEAWTGDSVSASFDAKFYKGYQPFTIKKGENTTVTLTCGIANVVASVKYDTEVADALSDYSIRIGHARGSLEFAGNETRKGYFMMPDGVTDLNWTLTGRTIDGKTFTKQGIIANVKRATEYRVNVKYTGNLPDVGGVSINVIVDETEIMVNDEFVITTAPVVSGVDFNLDDTQQGVSGEMNPKMVYVSAASRLQSLVVHSEELETMGLMPNPIDFITITDADRDNLLKKGIKQIYQCDESKGEYNSVINFSSVFVNSLPAGEYSIDITATDVNGMTGRGVLSLSVEQGSSNAPTIVSETLDLAGTNIVTPDLVAKVDINVPNGVETFFVEIISETLNAEVLESVGLAAEFDLAHPGDLEEVLTELGFPTGDDVIGKTYLPFDITMFMELLVAFEGQHQFKLTVTDAEGQAVTATLTFLVEGQ